MVVTSDSLCGLGAPLRPESHGKWQQNLATRVDSKAPINVCWRNEDNGTPNAFGISESAGFSLEQSMNPDDLYNRYQELQRYVGWTDEDAMRVRSVAEILDAHLGLLIDDFYVEIQKHPDAVKVITGGAAQIERLKGTLREWLRELLTGPYD